MKGSNSLTSHHPESSNSRADKMSGSVSAWKKFVNMIFRKNHEDHQQHGKASSKFSKRFYSKKRRQFLKNEDNWDKL